MLLSWKPNEAHPIFHRDFHPRHTVHPDFDFPHFFWPPWRHSAKQPIRKDGERLGVKRGDKCDYLVFSGEWCRWGRGGFADHEHGHWPEHRRPSLAGHDDVHCHTDESHFQPSSECLLTTAVCICLLARRLASFCPTATHAPLSPASLSCFSIFLRIYLINFLIVYSLETCSFPFIFFFVSTHPLSFSLAFRFFFISRAKHKKV